MKRATVALPKEAQKAVGQVRSVLFGRGEGAKAFPAAVGDAEVALDLRALLHRPGGVLRTLLHRPGGLWAGCLVLLTFLLVLLRCFQPLLTRSRMHAKAEAKVRGISLQLPLAVDAWCTASRRSRGAPPADSPRPPAVGAGRPGSEAAGPAAGAGGLEAATATAACRLAAAGPAAGA